MQQRAPLSRRKFLVATAATGIAAAGHAQGNAPLRLVSGYAPGGSTDRVARLVAEKLEGKLGRTVIVENKPGAGGRLAAQQLKTTPADQAVLMIANPAVMVVAPLVFKDNGYDAGRDYTMVSHVNNYDFAISVSTAVPVKELSHLVAWLRANPEKANLGVPATGSLPHFFALMLGERANVKAQVVGYKGSGPLTTDLIGGQIPVSIDTFETVLPQHEGGKLRILAVSGAKRSPFAPDIPTFREAGVDIVATGWNAFFAPSSMPATEVDRLARAIKEVMDDPDTQRKFNAARLTPVSATRAQSQAMLRAYKEQWGPVVKKSGYQP
ncbi:twin-arginine translocation signal domain-containing protein [Ramlibacter sp. USB13]|uniref:Twin-arginine translocation signal domain-containing protein n=1 Tax=Ramlibacter cellulosilyticus TaxID=2764187 RepID=A0A923SC46_9BURK|nr:Bug family tripartite tricarboxylate transporter substrate binding protein [Ramlibacter cellulosilyticus]MBC5784586.1 twin-arginine translocation signal domain-containing protein [Ramlibacter cellulosilyticus]